MNIWGSRREVTDDAWQTRDCLLIASLCLVIYLVGNSRISLWDRDEPRYAQAAREMLASGDFIVPTFNGEPRYHKPVFIYWLMAACYAVFGVNEFAARFASAIAGTATCLITYWLGTRMCHRRVGLCAALMLAVSPLMAIESKLATTDAVLTAICTAAFASLWRIHELANSTRVSSSSSTRVWALGFWSLIGLSVLVKGPVVFGVVTGVAIAWLALQRSTALLWRLHWFSGLALAALIVLPWGVAVHLATDGDFYREAIGKHVISRSVSAFEGHSGPPGYYVATAFVGLFPWSIGVPIALRGIAHWGRRDVAASLLVAWTIVPLIIFELIRTKLPHYYLPSYPAWAILLARGFVHFHDSGERLACRRAGWLRLGLTTMPIVALAGAASIWGLMRWPIDVAFPLATVLAVLALGTLVAAWCFSTFADRVGWQSLVATWALSLVLAFGWLLPKVEPYRIERTAANELAAIAAQSRPVALFAFREPSLVFYFGDSVPMYPTSGELSERVRELGEVWTLLRDRDVRTLEKRPELAIEVAKRFEAPALNPLPARSLSLARVRRCDATISTLPAHHLMIQMGANGDVQPF